MADLATPNLPSRDFEATQQFYAQFGFDCGYMGDGWMILHRGPEGSRAVLEFFPWPDLDPYQSNFSCCIRLDDLPAMMEQIEKVATQIETLKHSQEDAALVLPQLIDLVDEADRQFDQRADLLNGLES